MGIMKSVVAIGVVSALQTEALWLAERQRGPPGAMAIAPVSPGMFLQVGVSIAGGEDITFSVEYINKDKKKEIVTAEVLRSILSDGLSLDLQRANKAAKLFYDGAQKLKFFSGRNDCFDWCSDRDGLANNELANEVCAWETSACSHCPACASVPLKYPLMGEEQVGEEKPKPFEMKKDQFVEILKTFYRKTASPATASPASPEVAGDNSKVIVARAEKTDSRPGKTASPAPDIFAPAKMLVAEPMNEYEIIKAFIFDAARNIPGKDTKDVNFGDYELGYLTDYCEKLSEKAVVDIGNVDTKKVLNGMFEHLAYLHGYNVLELLDGKDNLCEALDTVKEAKKHLLSADVLSGFQKGDVSFVGSDGVTKEEGSVDLKFLTKAYLSAILRARLDTLVGDDGDDGLLKAIKDGNDNASFSFGKIKEGCVNKDFSEVFISEVFSSGGEYFEKISTKLSKLKNFKSLDPLNNNGEGTINIIRAVAKFNAPTDLEEKTALDACLADLKKPAQEIGEAANGLGDGSLEEGAE